MNIRNDDIADGNPKLTLGLIWTIILHFQVEWPPTTFCCCRSLQGGPGNPGTAASAAVAQPTPQPCASSVA